MALNSLGLLPPRPIAPVPSAIPRSEAGGELLFTLAPPAGVSIPLVLFALPVIVLTAFSVAAVIDLWPVAPEEIKKRCPTGPRFAFVVASLIVGPTFVFAPVPESHMLGGAALLLQTLCILKAMRAESVAGVKSAADGAYQISVRGAFLWGLLAVGFSLSNLAPAAILMFGLHSVRCWNMRRSLLAGLGLGIFLFIAWPHAQDLLAFESNWLGTPHLSTLAASARQLVVLQFGVPDSNLLTWNDPYLGGSGIVNPFTGYVITSVYPRGAVSPVQAAACLLWLAGIGLWLRQSIISCDRRFAVVCASALGELIAFHSVYDTGEAYLFSPHAWPFVLLPGLVAFADGLQMRRFCQIACFAASIGLSAVQLVSGLSGLVKCLPFL